MCPLDFVFMNVLSVFVVVYLEYTVDSGWFMFIYCECLVNCVEFVVLIKWLIPTMPWFLLPFWVSTDVASSNKSSWVNVIH